MASTYNRTVGAADITISRIRWSRGGALLGHLRVEVTPPLGSHRAPLTISTDLTLTDYGNVSKLVDALRRDDDYRSGLPAALPGFIASVIDAERALQQPIRLKDIRPSGPDNVVEIDGLPVLLQHPMIVYGDGGLGKSYLALWLAGRLAQQGQRVMYLDWELDGPEHSKRLTQLFGTPSPDDIWYERAEAPLAAIADQLRGRIEELGISYVICDSAGFACEGSPSEPEAATSFFAGLRSVGRVGSLTLAHITKNGDQEKPFGSVFWHNGARATWFMSRLEQTERLLRVQLMPKKSNLAPKLQTILGFDLEGDGGDGRMTISPSTPDIVPAALTEKLADKVEAILREKGPMLRDDIYAAIDEKSDSLKKCIQRGAGRRFMVQGNLVSLPDQLLIAA
jgi:hypothetical protein